jgi:hypothetical protein
MSKASVQTLIDKGVLGPDTPVRKTTMPNWLAIKHMREFESKAPVPVARPSAAAPAPGMPIRPSATPARKSLWSRFTRLLRGRN